MPLDRIIAVLNMDMIGRNEEVPVGVVYRFRGLAIQSAESNRNTLNLLGHSNSPSLKRTIEKSSALFGISHKQFSNSDLWQIEWFIRYASPVQVKSRSCTEGSGSGLLTRQTSTTAGAVAQKALNDHFLPPNARSVPGQVVLCKLLRAVVL